MAFFSDGRNEYFSLCLNPSNDNRTYIYRLSNRQRRASEFGQTFMLVISTSNIFSLFAISIVEPSGHLKFLFTNDEQELLVLLSAGVALLITLFQLIGFLTLRPNVLTAKERAQLQKSLCPERIMPIKSFKAYFTFLSNLFTPFVGLAALPGGLPMLFSDFPNYGVGYKLFLAQISFTLCVFVIVLTGRIISLVRLEQFHMKKKSQ